MTGSVDEATCFSCEGTLLIPTVDDRVSHWRERLVSGNRLTIMLKVVGQRWASDAAFLLWGENYMQEKVFEVNLKYVRGYVVRTRTWHEITSSDRRRFALNFHDSNQFSRFLDELVSTLGFLKKLTTTTLEADDDGGIVVLRVDKMAPPKPPRGVEQPPTTTSVDAQTPLLQEHHSDPQSTYLELDECIATDGGSSSGTESTKVPPPQEEQTTKWYVNSSGLTVTRPAPPVPKRNSDDLSGIYETIEDPASRPSTPSDEGSTHLAADTYDNISDALLVVQPSATKMKETNGFSGSPGGPVQNGHHPSARKSTEVHLYDDRAFAFDNTGSYENKNSCVYDNAALDFEYCRTVAAKSKPMLLPPRGKELTGTRSRGTGSPRVTGSPRGTGSSVVSNGRSSGTTPVASSARPLPQPKPRKPRDGGPPLVDVGEWKCQQCTLLNAPTVKRCTVCDMERHGLRVPNHVTGGRSRDAAGTSDAIQRAPSVFVVPSACFQTLTTNQWTCSVCSMKNERGSDVCLTCSAWVCGHCTLHNHPDLWVCSVCARSRLLP